MSRDLGTGTRVAAYVAGLGLAFAAAYGVGQAVGPLDVGDAPGGQTEFTDDEHDSTDQGGGTHGD